MSDPAHVRIVEETPCSHGRMKRHVIDPCSGPCLIPQDHDECSGGSNRSLTQGQYVLIEKAEGRWAWPLGINPLYWSNGASVDIDDLLDYVAHALSEGSP